MKNVLILCFLAITFSGFSQNPRQIRVTRQKYHQDSLLRDSLIKVAQGYKIPFSITDDYNPDISWLYEVIRQKEYNLKKGNYYNEYNITALINLMQEKLTPPISYATGFLILQIDDDGSIISVHQWGLSNVLEADMTAINNILDGKKITPYTVNGKNYPSYKRLAIKFFPKINKTFILADAGEIYDAGLR